MKRPIQSPQRAMRLLGLRVDGTGTASILEGSLDASLTDNGTGDYTISFNEPFVRVPVCVATTLTADSVPQLASVSVSAVNVKFFDATDGTTAKDVDFHLMVLGADVADQI